MGLFSNIFREGAVLYITARTTGEFGVREQIAIDTGDTCMHSDQLATSNGDMHKASLA